MTSEASVAISGAGGFLGWHTRAALRESGANTASLQLGHGFDVTATATALSGAHRVLHLAGVNRGRDDEVGDGNRHFAEQLAQGLRSADVPPRVVVYANSIQAENGSVYGDSKARAGEVLATAASDVGAEFYDVRLPNLFGEHGRPFYNSVTATFCHQLATGESPRIDTDRELVLLHAQDAADVLLGDDPGSDLEHVTVRETVTGLLAKLTTFAATYSRGEIPDIAVRGDRDLFNTYRSFTFPAQTPIPLSQHSDARGSFFETVRSHGGTGQTSFSTTVPGVTRGDHFHRRKIERFIVIGGKATIRLRRLFTRDVVQFEVSGDEPVAVDMPTMWAHSIENTGTTELLTAFWTNDIFDPANPDTIAERAVQ